MGISLEMASLSCVMASMETSGMARMASTRSSVPPSICSSSYAQGSKGPRYLQAGKG